MAGLSPSPFDYQAAKARVLRAAEAALPVQAKRFLATAVFDALALAFVQHAAARFEASALVQALERAERLRLEGLRPGAVRGRLRALQVEADAHQADMSLPYCQALLRFRRYSDHQATAIFEAVFHAVVAVAADAMPQLTADIEVAAGELLLPSHFNVYKRRHAPPPLDTLSLMELHALRTLPPREAGGGPGRARLLARLHDWPPPLCLRRALVSHTPLVASFVPSPFVRRRQALMQRPGRARPRTAQGAAGRPLRPSAREPYGAGGEAPPPLFVDAAGVVTSAALAALGRLRLRLAAPAPGGEPGARGEQAMQGRAARAAP